ncbi:MAG: hypothetical protein PWP51_2453 [Clostridiales bacterium]|nr:hypothetical protein [Clostridiales bacterium]MDN5299900.1 hypothetical protein [Clostridiales bacterium]
MIKFRLYFDKDLETEWLNEMAAKGYAMTGFFAGFYMFENCEPGKYIYQVDLGNRFFSVSNDYREFMNDTGVEIVQTWGLWIILRRLSSAGKFELYTDVDSSIAHYTKIRRMFIVVLAIEICCFFIELFGAMAGIHFAQVFLFLLIFIVAAFVNIILKTSQTIAKLEERKGGRY